MQVKRFGLCFCFSLFTLACWAGQDIHSNDDTRTQRYFKTLYPHDMPLRKNYWTGKMEHPKYLVVTTTSTYTITHTGLSDGYIFAVTAEELETSANSDKLFTVFISLMKTAGAGYRLLDRIDITDSSPIQNEIPGNFLDMQAHMDTFFIEPQTEAVHLSWWAVLAGTGENSATSDLFFKISDGKLIPILELGQTSTSGNAGTSGTPDKRTRIFVADMNQDGVNEILSQSFEKYGEPTTICFPSAVEGYIREDNMVYTYNGTKYQQSGSLKGKELENFYKLEMEKAPFTKLLTNALDLWSYEH